MRAYKIGNTTYLDYDFDGTFDEKEVGYKSYKRVDGKWVRNRC